MELSLAHIVPWCPLPRRRVPLAYRPARLRFHHIHSLRSVFSSKRTRHHHIVKTSHLRTATTHVWRALSPFEVPTPPRCVQAHTARSHAPPSARKSETGREPVCYSAWDSALPKNNNNGKTAGFFFFLTTECCTLCVTSME